jgi:hypothetical protein
MYEMMDDSRVIVDKLCNISTPEINGDTRRRR